ncbi:MAG: hypothetical protein ABGX17_05950, partial [Desulfurobacteriaceae bacterium]
SGPPQPKIKGKRKRRSLLTMKSSLVEIGKRSANLIKTKSNGVNKWKRQLRTGWKRLPRSLEK